MNLTPDAHNDFKADVLKRYPEEACGLVIGGKYYPCTNVLANTNDKDGKEINPRLGAFSISSAERLALSAAHGTVDAVLHSHPYKLYDSRVFVKEHRRPEWPSVADQSSFIADTCVWGIVATDGIGLSDFCWLTNDPLPFEKRSFEWFVSDCYTIVRDWHKVNGVGTLPNFTREFEFWKKSLNTIEDAIKAIPGAQRLPREKAEVGDMAVFAMGSPNVNHLGVIVSPNEMLHQPAMNNWYSAEVSWADWMHKAKYVVRFSK